MADICQKCCSKNWTVRELCKAWKPIDVCLDTHLDKESLQQFGSIIDLKKNQAMVEKIKENFFFLNGGGGWGKVQKEY